MHALIALTRLWHTAAVLGVREAVSMILMSALRPVAAEHTLTQPVLA